MRTVLAPSSAITNILRRRFSSAVFTRSSSAEPAPAADSLEFEKSSDSATESLAATSVEMIAASAACCRSAERVEVDEAAFDERLEEEPGSALPELEGELERAAGGVPERSE